MFTKNVKIIVFIGFYDIIKIRMDKMQNILTKYCIEDNDNGLLLIDMPTGSGKTYNIIEFIFNNFDKLKKKVFFITPLKKNLTYDKLMDRFKKENRLEEFEKFVLYIKSNLDTIIDNFSTVYDSMPDKIKYDKATKHIKVLIEIIKSRTSSDFKTEAQNSLREDWEPEFRSIVENYVLFNIDGSKRNYEQRLKFIDEDAAWINLLYPASMTDKAKVIFMTVDKFLSMNSTIVRPSYTIISDDIIKNSLIFIDEFDSAKENMLNNIIQNALNTKIALLDLYHAIYAGLTVCDFTKKLMTPSQYNINKKDKSYNFFNPDEIVDQIRENAEKIKDKYNLQFLHKLESNVKDNAYFMFQDHRFISVLPNQNSYLLLNTCKADKINKIIPSKSSTTEFELKDLLFDLKNFITFFQIGVGFIANNYRQLKLESKEDKNIISYDACVKTVLSEFGIEGKFLSYLTKNIVRKKKNKNITSSPLSDDLDFSCNEKGFRYYTILDSDVYDTQSKIQYVAIDDTPEKILLSVCYNAKVIGVSASSTLRTVTGNFDINYLEVRLGRLFKHLTKEERIYLKEKFEKQTCFYDKIELKTKSILVNELNYEKIINSFDSDISQVIWELFSKIEKTYDKCRYLKLFLCMKYFIEDNNQKSFLFLTNKLLRDNDKTFDFIEAKNIFDMLTQKQNISAEICALFGDIETYEQKKIEIEKKLTSGQKVMVVSSYQTLGAGQNIQYKIPKHYVEAVDYIAINDLDYSDKEKDFDAIYLDKPTNIFVNMNNDLLNEEQFIKFIYQVKMLEESGDIKEDVAYRYIKDGFEFYNKLKKTNFKTPENSLNLKLHSAKIIQQAIGRICRTKNKSPHIHIYYDEQLKTELGGVQKSYKNILINPEFKQFLNEINNSIVDNNITAYENAANVVRNESSKYISKLMNFKNDNIGKWEKLREIVLKNPTTDIPTDAIGIYLQLPNIANQYSFDVDNKKISFSKTIGEMINQENSGLNNMLLIPGVYKYFEEIGYATSFKRAKYMLTPDMFSRIYKGALGEAVGEFILRNRNIQLERIRDVTRYEKFDFYVKNTYIDFKNFSGYMDLQRNVEVEKIKNKLKECNGKNAVIINILKPKDINPEMYTDNIDGNVVIIPYLYDIEKREFNNKALILLKNLIDL